MVRSSCSAPQSAVNMAQRCGIALYGALFWAVGRCAVALGEPRVVRLFSVVAPCVGVPLSCSRWFPLVCVAFSLGPCGVSAFVACHAIVVSPWRRAASSPCLASFALGLLVGSLVCYVAFLRGALVGVSVSGRPPRDGSFGGSRALVCTSSTCKSQLWCSLSSQFGLASGRLVARGRAASQPAPPLIVKCYCSCLSEVLRVGFIF